MRRVRGKESFAPLVRKSLEKLLPFNLGCFWGQHGKKRVELTRCPWKRGRRSERGFMSKIVGKKDSLKEKWMIFHTSALKIVILPFDLIVFLPLLFCLFPLSFVLLALFFISPSISFLILVSSCF